MGATRKCGRQVLIGNRSMDASGRQGQEVLIRNRSIGWRKRVPYRVSVKAAECEECRGIWARRSVRVRCWCSEFLGIWGVMRRVCAWVVTAVTFFNNVSAESSDGRTHFFFVNNNVIIKERVDQTITSSTIKASLARRPWRLLTCPPVWFLAIWSQGVLRGHYSVMLVE